MSLQDEGFMKEYSKEFLIRLLRIMLKIRICEESFISPILQNEIQCPVHLYSGEEAVAAGVCAALTRSDTIFGTHRSHGHFLAKGGDLNQLVSEIYGKETGCSRGRGGSMHLIDPENGIMGATPIVAGTISLAVGAALASKIRKSEKIVACFFGDGATGEGVLFESMNFAALHKLPVIFVCENNCYSTHMPIEDCRPNNDIFKIGDPFDIPSHRVDGNNVLEVYEISQKAVDMCRSGHGPFFIECLTYRLRGHVGPDDNVHGKHMDIRSTDEIEKWKEKDPITTYKNHLLSRDIIDERNFTDMVLEIEKEVEDAFRFAKRSSYPPGNDLPKYVFK